MPICRNAGAACLLLALLVLAVDASNVGEVLAQQQQQAVAPTKKVAVSKSSSAAGSPQQCIESWYVVSEGPPDTTRERTSR